MCKGTYVSRRLGTGEAERCSDRGGVGKKRVACCRANTRLTSKKGDTEGY